MRRSFTGRALCLSKGVSPAHGASSSVSESDHPRGDGLSDGPGTAGGDAGNRTEFLSRLEACARQALEGLSGSQVKGFVCSDVYAVDAALSWVTDKDFARGPVFCEWGSGLGVVSALAASHAFDVYGIEIQLELVEAARELVAEMGVVAEFAQGSFLLPGDESLLDKCDQTRAVVSRDAYKDLELTPESCDIVFAYPWPGEEMMIDLVFERHAAKGALLLTYHENSRVLVQRHMGANQELMPLQWVG